MTFRSIGDSLTGVPCLVTGGAGFIGSHLVDGLLGLGAVVTVMDNLVTDRLANIEHALGRIRFLESDIRDLKACQEACEGQSFVFHQAALGSVPRSIKDPAASFAVNVSGTANVFMAARDAGVKRVVYASSSSVFGDSEALPKREGQEGRPLSPYALSKVMNEELAEIFGRCYSMELFGLRYFNVYGPRQDPNGPYAAVIPRFFDSLLQGRAPVVYGDGEQSRDFTFVEDAVAANFIAAVAEAPPEWRAFNVAKGEAVTVNHLARAVRDLCGGGPEPVYEPERPGDVKHSLADLTRAREGLGFSPEVGIEEGLQRAFGYYKGNANSDFGFRNSE